MYLCFLCVCVFVCLCVCVCVCACVCVCDRERKREGGRKRLIESLGGSEGVGGERVRERRVERE